MTKFVEYMSSTHLCNKNIALYENDNGASLVAEQVINDATMGSKSFPSVEDAKEWYTELTGNSMGQLSNALDILINDA